MEFSQIPKRKKDKSHKFSWKKNSKSTSNLKKGGTFWLFSLLLTNARGEYCTFFNFKKEFW
jgi:hypothetical protein